MKLGLLGTKKLLRVLGNPHHSLPAIHVAGTNGKGSTASMVAAVCTAAGYKTGLYTSPHLVSFTERIRIDGKPISEISLARYTEILHDQILSQKATFFEATTAIAFAYFVEQQVDIAVIETGLGGRSDSTNVLKPLASVITNVGLEHTDILGKTIDKIAYAKGGIVKRDTPCFTAIDDPVALDVIKKICKRKNALLTVVKPAHVQVKKSTLSSTCVNVTLGKKRFDNLEVSLAGSFQQANIALALSVLCAIDRSGTYRIPEQAMRHGLTDIQKYSGLQARFSVLQKNPLIIADVAHNAGAVESLISALRQLHINQVDMVFGVMMDKDYKKMIRDLRLIARRVIVVAPHIERAKPADDLVLAFMQVGTKAYPAQSVEEGIKLILQNKNSGVPILITGSHYVVGEALEYLNGR